MRKSYNLYKYIFLLIMVIYMKDAFATKIVTIFDEQGEDILSKKSTYISTTQEGIKEAQVIADQLINTLMTKMPAAGLAAPQIGISKRIFVFSWNRAPENIQVVINPKIIRLSDTTYQSWEACFSAIQEKGISKAALVTRHNWLIAEYMDLKGKIKQYRMDGFAAKVFQHEYDHLEGMCNLSKKNAKTKIFNTSSELINFMKNVKKTDSISYIPPREL